MNIIEINKLKKTYINPNETVVIFDNIDLKIEKGEFITIMGPSGSGKTTLLNIISTIDSKYEGKIYFENKELRKFTEKEKDFLRLKRIGYVFQFDSLIPELNIIENILLPSIIIGKPQKKYALHLLENFGLINLIKKYPSELSGGEKQRVALIRAVINKPDLIVADEPTGNLDEENAFKVMEDLKKLNYDGVTIIMVSHNFELVKKFSKKIYKIENKKLTSII